ncbi:MAG: AAA family ATPase [Planctomycetes bacterium]|nr:AAA family ATPase [Planctomycetota bacterium]
MDVKPLYISATLRDCGKTSVSLGMIQVLRDRGFDPGYCKPVGQHYVRYQNKNIDEDGVLVHQVFKLCDEPYYLSPIAIEPGFTQKFIENPDVAPLEQEIITCHQTLRQVHPMIIVEGTGHAGVGSCFGLSNARVAELLGAKVVIVTAGGIGRPLDEITLSLALFRQHNVKVLGVVLNKVLIEKYDKVKKTVAKGLRMLGTELLGAIPYEPQLSTFTMGQLAEEFNYTILCGHDHLTNRVTHTVVAAMEPQNVIRYIRDNTVVIIPGDRIDNILVSLLVLSRQEHNGGGLILTGGFDPHPMIEPLMVSSQLPILLSNEDTFIVSSRMKDLGFKIRSYDTEKISRLHELVSQYVDVDSILDQLKV